METKCIFVILIVGIISLDQTRGDFFTDLGNKILEHVKHIAEDQIILCRTCDHKSNSTDTQCKTPPTNATLYPNSTVLFSTTTTMGPEEVTTTTTESAVEPKRGAMSNALPDIKLPPSVCIRSKHSIPDAVGNLLEAKTQGVCFSTFWENGTMMSSGCTDVKKDAGCEPVKDGIQTCYCGDTLKTKTIDPTKVFDSICNVKSNPSDYQKKSNAISSTRVYYLYQIFLSMVISALVVSKELL